MAKWYGKVGYAISEEEKTTINGVEVGTGVWKDRITERNYYGETMKTDTSTWRSGESLNDDLVLYNTISILADPFAFQYFYTIKYAELFGTLWKVVGTEAEYPRLKLTLGGVYNGEIAEPEEA